MLNDEQRAQLVQICRSSQLAASTGFPQNKDAADLADAIESLYSPVIEQLVTTQVDTYRDALIDMVHQFAYESTKDDHACIFTGGLSVLEHAFGVLGYDDPYMTPARECDVDDCHQHAHCGTPTDDGYKRLCTKHYIAHEKARGEL